MIKSARLIGLVLLTVALAACHRGQDISFDGHSVSLHAANQPTATITSRGSFSVGSKLIKITPTERQLFLRYYNQVTGIHQDTEAVKHAGMDIAGQGLHMAGQSIKQAVGLAEGSSTGEKAMGQAMHAKAQALTDAATQLCQEAKQAQALQATLADQIPAFEPYADINPAPGVDCDGHVVVNAG